MKGSDDLNPGLDGTARPVTVRVLQLASVSTFLESDFFSLDSDLQGTLGRALLAEETFSVAPNAVQVYQRALEPDARYVAAMASLRVIDGADWRAFVEPPAHTTSLYAAVLDARGVALRPAGL